MSSSTPGHWAVDSVVLLWAPWYHAVPPPNYLSCQNMLSVFACHVMLVATTPPQARTLRTAVAEWCVVCRVSVLFYHRHFIFMLSPFIFHVHGVCVCVSGSVSLSRSSVMYFSVVFPLCIFMLTIIFIINIIASAHA